MVYASISLRNWLPRNTLLDLYLLSVQQDSVLRLQDWEPDPGKKWPYQLLGDLTGKLSGFCQNTTPVSSGNSESVKHSLEVWKS